MKKNWSQLAQTQRQLLEKLVELGNPNVNIVDTFSSFLDEPAAAMCWLDPDVIRVVMGNERLAKLYTDRGLTLNSVNHVEPYIEVCGEHAVMEWCRIGLLDTEKDMKRWLEWSKRNEKWASWFQTVTAGFKGSAGEVEGGVEALMSR